MRKRILSILLTLAIVISFIPQTVIPVNAADAADGTISVESVTGMPGSSVDVNISIANNPGILGATLTLEFGAGLTLTKAKAGTAFDTLAMTTPGKYTSPCNFVWDGQSIAPEDVKDGVILTLTFDIAESVTTGTEIPVEVSYAKGGIVDGDLNTVQPAIVNGGVTVVSYVPGDVNSDGVVNVTDIIFLRRHIAGGYDITINELAGDVNADGDRNTTDVILIRRYIAGDWGVTLVPGKLTGEDTHELVAVAAKAHTCTADGIFAHWYCEHCGKYYSDADGNTEITKADTVDKADHTNVIIDEAVGATPTSSGLTAGSHCGDCNKVIVAQKVIPPLEVTEHNITYDIANGDTYLEKQVSLGNVTNNNPDAFDESSVLVLKNLSVPGYRFLGWYDGAGDNATQVKRIESGTTYDVELYAHWEKISYTVQYKSDLFLDKSSETYTVDTGLVLPTPKLSNYVFAGWSDEDGNLYSSTKIPAGTTGNITLNANWTSERNKTWTKPVLGDPIIHMDEENDTIYFAYEIGEIQNVPLYTIKDFGYISGDGITKTETVTYATTVSEEHMEAYTKAVAKATTESSNWTLSEEWSEATAVDEQWCQENGYTKEEAETLGKSETGTWNVSNSKSGSTDTTHLETNEDNWQNEVKINSSSESTNESKIAAGVTSTLGVEEFGVKAEISAELDVEESNSTTNKNGMETGRAKGNTEISTDSTVTSSGWNTSSSYSGSNTSSSEKTTSTEVSEKICQTYGYGKEYVEGGSSESAQGLSSTSSSSDEYAASVTYGETTSEEVTSTWTTQATKPGYHRWVVAGTAHVFGVVGYNMSTQAYFVYTYSVMDDETHEFEDYSYTTASYNDQQNGVISFSVPFEVTEYVSDLTCGSSGLKVDQETGVITGYSGTDNCVVIPEYMNVGNGDVVKITGISSTAFSGNTDIAVVVLSDYITEIPDGAFEGCTSLEGVTGGAITKIGDNAFSGCTSLVDCGIHSNVVSVGENAFAGVGKLQVNAANASVVQAAANSGANQIVLYLNNLENTATCLSDGTLTIPEGTEYFEFNGYGKTFNDLTIISDADMTVINKANFVSSGKIPIQISSPEVILNQVTVSANGIAMVLSAENANVGLQGTNTVSSENTNALLSKNVTLYESNPNVVGKLVVNGTMLICGDAEGSELLTATNYMAIDAETFDRMLHSYTLYFDPNGGTCDTASREVPNGTAIGQMPTPEKQYYTFTGWYLADGTKVTEDTVFSTGLDQTVYATWTPNTFTLTYNANGGTCSTTTATMTYSKAIGTLPTPTRDYYTFNGWYTAASGGTQVTAETVFDTDADVTIYAQWTINELSGWVKASAVPTGGKVEEQKWAYTLTTKTESKSTSLSGYTQTGSYWVKSGSGSSYYASFPGGFDTSNSIYTSFMKSAYSSSSSTTTKREVSNAWAGYVYWHWMYDCNGATAYDRAIYDRKGTGPTNGYAYKYFGAFTSSTSYTAGTGYCNNLGATVYYNTGRTSYADSQGSKYWFRFNYYKSTYTDYYKMFQYQKVESKESTTKVTAGTSGNSTISDVQEWVRYRPI